MKQKYGHKELRDYLCSPFHKEINDYLRQSDRKDLQLDAIALEIDNSLNEAKSYNNSIVFHCGLICDIPVEIFSLWFIKRIGKFVKFPSFLSTTTDPDYFFKNQPKVFKIYTSENSNGKDISVLGFPPPMEGEIMFKRNTTFEILQMEKGIITLKEINNEFKDDFFCLIMTFFLEEEKIREYIKQNQAPRSPIRSLSDQGLI